MDKAGFKIPFDLESKVFGASGYFDHFMKSMKSISSMRRSKSGSERCRNKRLKLQNADSRKSRGPYGSPPHVGKISFG